MTAHAYNDYYYGLRLRASVWFLEGPDVITQKSFGTKVQWRELRITKAHKHVIKKTSRALGVVDFP